MLLLAGACDQHGPTDPAAVSSARKSESGGGGSISGTTALPIRYNPYYAQYGFEGGIQWLPLTRVVAPGRYRVRARVQGYVYQPATYGDHCAIWSTPTSGRRYGPGGLDGIINSAKPTLRPALRTVVVTQQADDPLARITYVPLAPVGGDSSTFEGEMVVQYDIPWVLYFGRGAEVSTYACKLGGEWATDQQVAFSVAPEPLTPPQQPKIVLTCTGDLGPNRVTRGREIACTARKEPADAQGELRILAWTFTGGGTSIKAQDGDASSPNWGGMMVVPGTITVEGTIGGNVASSASATVQVAERAWRGRIRYADASANFVGRPELPYPPVTSADLELKDGVLGLYVDAPPVASYGEGSGPNKGWVYVDEPPAFALTPLIYLNVALRPHDPFYRAQRGESGLRFSGRPPCGPSFMSAAAKHVPAHEEGHHRVAKNFYESTSFADSLERSRVYDPKGLKSTPALFSDLIGPLRDRLRLLQAAHDSADVLKIPCDFTPIGR